MRSNRAVVLLVRVTVTILFSVLCWRAAPAAGQAFAHRQFSLVQIFVSVAVLLITSAVGLELALRSLAPPINRFVVIILIPFCSVAAAIGSAPGLLFYSLPGSAMAIAGLGLGAALLGNVCTCYVVGATERSRLAVV